MTIEVIILNKYSNEMEPMWDKKKNKKTFNPNCSKDTTTFHWICNYKGRGCEFMASPKKIYHAFFRREKGIDAVICPICKEVDYEESILFHAPEKVEKYWDYERNALIKMFPQYTKVFSNKMIYCKCEKHHWIGIELYRCADLKDHTPCPYCSGKEATPENNIGVLFPDLAEELHPKHNKFEILPYSEEKCKWYCSKCKNYYPMMVKCRTSQNHGCPECHTRHHTSKTEAIIREILNKYIGGFKKKKLSGLKWKNGHRWEIDIFHHKYDIVIEYDGNHHKNREKVDQEKLNILSKHFKIKLHIRIRDEELPELEFKDNQFVVKCAKHHYKYLFLLSPLMEVFDILKRYVPFNGKITKKQLKKDLVEIVPKIHITGSFIREEDIFATKFPGLIRYFIGDIAPNPYEISYGSNSLMMATCPKCKESFKSTPKKLSLNKGKCPNRECFSFVTDIYVKDSPLKRWYRKAKYDKSLEKNNPSLSRFYSNRNPLGANEIYANSHYHAIWNCPYCLEEYEATVDAQSRNGCKCQKANFGKNALNNEDNLLVEGGDVKILDQEQILREVGPILGSDIEVEGRN
jgi:very-short-patch-repair endonuclease